MKSNTIIIDSMKMEEIIGSLESSYNRLTEIFSNEDNNKEIINGTDVWTSAAQQALYDKYSLLSNSFKNVEYSLDIYIKFLRKTLEDYKMAENEIVNNIDLIANELDVNS